MNRVFVIGVVKLIVIYFPLAFIILAAYYLASNILSDSGLGWIIAILGGIVVGLLFWLFNIILGPTMSKLKAEKYERINNENQ